MTTRTVIPVVHGDSLTAITANRVVKVSGLHPLEIGRTLRAGFTTEEIFNLTRIDREVLVQIKEILDPKEDLTGAKN